MPDPDAQKLPVQKLWDVSLKKCISVLALSRQRAATVNTVQTRWVPSAGPFLGGFSAPARGAAASRKRSALIGQPGPNRAADKGERHQHIIRCRKDKACSQSRRVLPEPSAAPGTLLAGGSHALISARRCPSHACSAQRTHLSERRHSWANGVNTTFFSLCHRLWFVRVCLNTVEDWAQWIIVLKTLCKTLDWLRRCTISGFCHFAICTFF